MFYVNAKRWGVRSVILLSQTIIPDCSGIKGKSKSQAFCKSGFLIALLCFTLNAYSQAPTITSFSPQAGYTGTSVTITGTNFNTTLANNIVYFGATKGTVTSATSTQLTVNVPVGATFKPISVLNTGTGLSAYTKKPFMPTIASYTSSNFTSTSFSSYTYYQYGVLFRGIAAADFDGDGKVDIVATSTTGGNNVYILRNTSSGSSVTFSATPVTLALGASSRLVYTGDIDNDGKIDIFVASQTSTNLFIFRNTSTSGSISFGSRVDISTDNNVFSAAIGDLNADGKPDLALSTVSGSKITVLKNGTTPGTIASTSFTKTNFTANTTTGGIAIGDIDGDDKPDIAVAENDGNLRLSLYKNTITNGTIDANSFAAKVDFEIATPGSFGIHYTVALGDLDGDGKLDIVVPKQGSSAVAVYRNTSTVGTINTGSLAAKVDLPINFPSFGGDLADMNGDGKLDIVVVSSTKAVVIRNIATSGSLTTSSFATGVEYNTSDGTAGSSNAVALADLNGDGKTDIVPSLPTSSFTMSVILNNLTNTPPSTPSDVNVAANTIAENSANGSTVGITANSVDADGSSVTYSLTGNAGGRFAINSSTGVVTVANGTLLDYETTTSHTITVQASDGSMTSSQSFTINVTDVVETTPLVATISSSTNVSCNGGSNGTATVSVSGGTSPYSYSWSPSGGTAATTTGRSAGTYTVTVTDASSTTTTATITITQPSAFSSSAVQMNVSCYGGSNGLVGVSVSGATAPYSYAWSPSGGTSATASGRPAGSYTVTITDNNGCTTTRSFTITQPLAPVSGSTVVTNVACFGGSNGSIDLAPTGGTAGYSYNWGNGITTQDRTSLAAGTYTVIITDANSCTGTVTTSVTQPTAPVSGTTVVTNVACFGGSNGSIDLTPSGGTPGYTYNWGSGNTTQDRTSLAAGTYTVIITDAKSCTGTVTTSVTQPANAVSVAVTAQTNATCSTTANGSATATASGGTAPYSYNWSPSGGTANTATGLSAGTYTISVTDANSCVNTATTSITATSAAGNPAIFGNGVWNVYAWNAGAPTANSDSWNTNYSGYYTVSDLNLNTLNQWGGTSTPSNASGYQGCAVGVDYHSYSAKRTGFTCGYYSINIPSHDDHAQLWVNGAMVWEHVGCCDSHSNVWQGFLSASSTVDFRVTEGGGDSYGSITFTSINASVTGTTNICNGTPASLTAAPVSGANILWSTGETTSNISAPATGTYSVTVSDPSVASCSLSASVAVTEMAATINSQNNVTTHGGSDGSVSVSVSGGTPGYTYDWAPGTPTGDGTNSISGLSAGSYTVTITDAQGCSTSQTATITQPAAVAVSSIISSNPSPAATTSVSYTVTFSGSVSGLSTSNFSLTTTGLTGAGIASVSGAGNTYTVIVTTGTGNGTLRLDFDNNTGMSVPVTNAPYTGGQVYTITKTFINPVLTIQAAGSIGGGADVTAFIDNVQLLQASNNALVNGALSNSSFENFTSLSNGNYGYNPAGASWAFNTRSGIALSGSAFSVHTPPAGSAVAFLQSNSGLHGMVEQALSLTDGSYKVSFSAAQRNYQAPNDQRLNVFINNVFVGTILPANNEQYASFTSDAFMVVAAPTDIALSNNLIAENAVSGTAVGTIIAASGTPGETYTYTLVSGTGSTNNASFAILGDILQSAAVFDFEAQSSYSIRVRATSNNYPSLTFEKELTVSVTNENELSVSGTQTNVSCFGGNDGAASVTVTGESGSYTYSWFNNTAGIAMSQTTNNVTGLSQGSYTATITDAVTPGFTATQSFTITQPAAPVSSSATVTSPSCVGSSDGTVTVTPTGGTSPYSFAWSSGATTATVTGLSAGIYSVIISDANGCTTSDTITLSDPAAITAFASSNSPVALGNTLHLSATGGSTYTWSGPNGFSSFDQNPQILNATAANGGQYTLTAVSAQGCSNTVYITVSVGSVMYLTINQTQPASSTNFTSFAAAATYLNTTGVSQPTVVNVVTGTGPYTGKLLLTSVPGASANNTLTINGNGNTLTGCFGPFNGNRDMIRLDGTDHITINGFVLDGSACGDLWGVHLLNDNENVTISNNTILHNPAYSIYGANHQGIIAANSFTATGAMAGVLNNITITGNTINHGYSAIRINGSSSDPANNLVISNNTLTGAALYGIITSYTNNPSVTGNQLNLRNVDPAQDIHSIGIQISYSENGLAVTGNKVANAGKQALFLSNVNEQSTVRGLVANNMLGGGMRFSSPIAMQLNYANYLDVYFNSLNADFGTGLGLYVSNVKSRNLRVMNNSIAYTGASATGRAMSASGGFVNFTQLNYNNYYSTGQFVWFNNALRNNLVELRNSLEYGTITHDQQSTAANPMYVSATDLHLSAASFLQGMGTAINGIATDFDGQTRPTPPSIGADEFTAPPRLAQAMKTEGEVYPNPFRTTLTVAMEQAEGAATIKLVDMMGRTVYQSTANFAEGKVSLNPEVAQGVYLLQVTNNGVTSQFRVVKQ